MFGPSRLARPPSGLCHRSCVLGEWDFNKGAVMSLSTAEQAELAGVVQPALIGFLARCIGMDPDRPGQSAEDLRRELNKTMEFRCQVVSALAAHGRPLSAHRGEGAAVQVYFTPCHSPPSGPKLDMHIRTHPIAPYST